MKNRLSALAAFFLAVAPACPCQQGQTNDAQYRSAAPGYHYEFPRDHFDHPAFQTEWWYYTGNLKSVNGHRYGFELTFFRQGVQRGTREGKSIAKKSRSEKSVWDVNDLYLAHLALSDLDGETFHHSERMNRSGPGLAGSSQTERRVWNGNWQVRWNADTQELEAYDSRFAMRLNLRSLKQPVIHGENGISQKSEGPGHGSHYISLTRLETGGTIELNGKKSELSGLAWMDHEFFTQQLAADQAGWDWLGLQLDDNTELMLYRLRRKDGSVDPYSSGTYIDTAGKSTHLRSTDFIMQPQPETWTSGETRATYPIHWKISIAKLGINLEATTPLAQQEITSKSEWSPSYWEGAIKLTGQRDDHAVTGVGYLEMTGYGSPLRLGQ